MNALEEQLQHRMSERLKGKPEIEDLAASATQDVLRRVQEGLGPEQEEETASTGGVAAIGPNSVQSPRLSYHALPAWQSLAEYTETVSRDV